MTNKQYELQQKFKTLEFIDAKIDALVDELEKWEARALAVSPKLEEKVDGGNNCRSIVEDTVIKVIEIKEELKDEITKYKKLRNNLKAVISSLEVENERTVLEFRFLHYWKIEKIAGMMNYDKRQILRLQKDALNEILKNKNLLNLMDL